MIKLHAVIVVIDFLRKRAIPRGVSLPLVLLACLLLPSFPVLSQDAPARNMIRLMIMSDLNSKSGQDSVTITADGSDDKTLLMTMAVAMGKQFGGEPTFFAYGRGEEPFSDGGLALSFGLKVMPRDGHTLPTDDLLQCFAPFASRLRVLYWIQGVFAYAGVWQMENEDIKYTVTKISESPQSVPPYAIYDTEATITASSITSESIAENPDSNHGKKRSRMTSLYLLFGLAMVIGVSGGVLIAYLLKQWKTENAAQAAGASKGVRNERQRDDT